MKSIPTPFQSIFDQITHTKVCRKHLLGKWGRDRFGEWFPRCAVGKQINEDCEELVVEGGEEDEQK